MRGIIWYWKDSEQGKELFRRIIKGYEQQGVMITAGRGYYYERKYEARAVFDNGDIWDVYNASESRRGYKCNISYVSRSIPEEIVNVVIKPITLAPPYQGILYWQEEQEPIAVPLLGANSVSQ